MADTWLFKRYIVVDSLQLSRSSNSFLVLGAVILVVVVSRRMVKPTIPGPFLAKATNLVLRYHQIKQDAEIWIHALHATYGPIVQIGRNEISVTSSEAIRDIFAVHRRLNRPYEVLPFQNYGAENILTTFDGHLHAERRKCSRGPYNRRAVEGERVQGILEQCLNENSGLRGYIREGQISQQPQAIDVISSQTSETREINLFWLFRYFGVDFLSAFVYGNRFGLDLLRHDNENGRKKFKADFDWDEGRLKNYSTLFLALMPQLALWFRSLGWQIGRTPEDMTMSKLGRQAISFYGERSTEKAIAEPGETLCEQLTAKFEKEGLSGIIPSQEYVLSECLDHFWAGVVTTGDALLSTIFYLSHPRNKARQHRLRQELLNANVSLTSPNALEDLKQIKYLECIVRETLRHNPPVALSLTRILGQNDAVVVDGHKIPPNMRIGYQAYSVHRDPEVFPDAETWKPERWEDSQKYSAMKQRFLPFGAGPRMCIGLNVAWVQMHAAIASIYSHYETSLTKEVIQTYPEPKLGGFEKEDEKKKLTAIFKRLDD